MSDEEVLIDAIAAVFGRDAFDTASIIARAEEARHWLPLLTIVSGGRYRERYQRGRIRGAVLRRLLTSLARKHFDTDQVGYWYIKNR